LALGANNSPGFIDERGYKGGRALVPAPVTGGGDGKLIEALPSMSMLDHPLSAGELRSGLERLAALDPDLGRALARLGCPAPRQRRPGFATLVQIMTAQQLSTRSAAAIWARLEAACAGSVDPERFLALDDAALRAVGFSARKAAYGRGLARAVAEGVLDFEALDSAPEEEAIGAIAALHGFGRWSAEIYLLFALGRADVFPADDLALQIGMQRLRRLEARPRAAVLRELVEPWRPLRGCGAIFLWHLYGAATLDGGAQPASAAARR
jgi:DNA-3-methyladenine glycosylase II